MASIVYWGNWVAVAARITLPIQGEQATARHPQGHSEARQMAMAPHQQGLAVDVGLAAVVDPAAALEQERLVRYGSLLNRWVDRLVGSCRWQCWV